MRSRYLLAIDNGSQSTKVCVVDEHGRVHASAQRRLRPYDTSVPGHVVHPDDDLWDSIRDACTETLERFAGDRDEIVAVGLCTIRFCRALLDAHGRLVEPVLSWMDVRVSRPHDAADPRVAHVTTSSGYLTHRLTGRFLDTRANYQGVWPIDQATAEWSADPAAYVETGMPRALLSGLVSPGELLGTVTPEAAEATGIPAGLPVYATANDKAVEALGCGLRAPDVALLSLGTYIAAMATGSAPTARDAGYWVNFGSTPGEYLYESHGIRRGMWTVSWFRGLVDGGVARIEQAAPGDAEALRASSTEDLLNAEAAEVPPGCGGLVAIMDWLAPTEAPHRRGALVGFDGTQGRAHIYRAILEGIALTMVGHVRAMEEGLRRRFSALLVSGGGSRSDLMMQILADVFDLPTRRTAMPDAAGLGAAICAAVGSGIHPDWDTAVDEMVTAAEVFLPDPERVEVYRRSRRVYERLGDYTDPLFAFMDAQAPAVQPAAPYRAAPAGRPGRGGGAP
ncbi:MAG TPA: FGGY-family carbohydrate kinase [Intrasporangium sp.]|uniref:FGGY-family carbohydrate kinase n=1 Tax=Intrasporangium sp. TaxID=1925024 RepID=UPI002D7902C2|nr:FGGY-family carbohydrate kinase [Intrasporangium sp.]HET7397055.1 FGGY-family carbohydrate kinase [Intrasporangium sp.]